MANSDRKGVYVTGTDTGCGKTVASLALMEALKQRGLRVGGMKPVASGCDVEDGRLVNDDARQIRAACSNVTDYAAVNPWALPEPIAPHVAAARQGLRTDAGPVLEAWHRQARAADFIVVEGIGGWRVPLSETWEQSQLVQALDIPVVLVVGLRLGCINHARLTGEALFGDGVALRGWIANHVQPDYDTTAETLACLDDCLRVPRLGEIPYETDGRPARCGTYLEVEYLF